MGGIDGRRAVAGLREQQVLEGGEALGGGVTRQLQIEIARAAILPNEVHVRRVGVNAGAQAQAFGFAREDGAEALPGGVGARKRLLQRDESRAGGSVEVGLRPVIEVRQLDLELRVGGAEVVDPAFEERAPVKGVEGVRAGLVGARAAQQEERQGEEEEEGFTQHSRCGCRG